ncbi:MAG: hypothetical protein ACYDBV_08105, partial [Nitrospiria bacterium]
IRRLLDLLACQGVWLDVTLQPGGPGIPKGEPLTLVSPLKEEVVDKVERWKKDYDLSFLKTNRIQIKIEEE